MKDIYLLEWIFEHFSLSIIDALLISVLIHIIHCSLTYMLLHGDSCSVMSNSLQPMDCSPPDSSVHETFQARILEWVAISSLNPSNIRTLSEKRLPWWLKWQRIWLQCGRPMFNPWVGKTPWRRAWQSTPVFLPGESHRQRNLVGYSI